MSRAASVGFRSPDQRSITSQRTGDSTATQESALRGATLAFKSSPAPVRPLVNTYSGTNGALVAATRAGLSAPKFSEYKDTQVPTHSLAQQHSLKAGRDAFARKASIALNSPELIASAQASQRQSPSHVAASLAAARVPAGLTGKDDGRQPARARSTLSRASSHQEVELFEAKQQVRGPGIEVKANPAPGIVSPVPIRPPVNFLPVGDTSPPVPIPRKQLPPKPSSPSLRTLKAVSTFEGHSVTPVNSSRVPSTPPTLSTRSTKDATSFAMTTHDEPAPRLPARPVEMSPTMSETKPRVAPSLPPPRGSKAIRGKDPTLPVRRTTIRSNDSDTESTGSFASARDSFSPIHGMSRANTLARSSTQPQGSALSRNNSLVERKPVLPPPKPSTLQATRYVTVSPEPAPPTMPPRRTSSTVSYRRPLDSLKPQLTADSLANAIVSASLASSRAPSPSKSRPTPPPPRRSSKSHTALAFLLPSSSPPVSRDPSPMKSMRQTLRRTHSSSSDEGSKSPDHSHNIFKPKHPNKHAEGDRKRWRDAITELERKRYEGVWAANRGASVPVPGTGLDEVHGLAVKDIWLRSGLPESILERIWDLVVDGGRPESERRVLRKDEFVVGIWLVDQCLKGRRLPVEVGDSVWGSVRKLTSGVRLR
jgi:hypothetical protein